MRIFNPDNHEIFKRDVKAYAYFELAYTSIDFMAALLFIIGSVMFFYSAYVYAGTWCFVVGSVFFAMKPTLRISREIYYLVRGDYQGAIREGHE